MKVLIVDGHSVIFAWPELRKLHQKRMVLAREALLQRVSEYCSFQDLHGVVVFDGQGAQTEQEKAASGLQVFYAAADVSADEVIERLVARYAAEHELMVVTSDLLEQQTVNAFGGSFLSADAFKEQFEASAGEMRSVIKKNNAMPWQQRDKRQL